MQKFETVFFNFVICVVFVLLIILINIYSNFMRPGTLCTLSNNIDLWSPLLPMFLGFTFGIGFQTKH